MQGFILPEDETTAVESIDTILLATRRDSDDPAEILCPPATMKLYGESDEGHLSSGRNNYLTICRAIERVGLTIYSVKRLVEFGCSNSRILRWFLPHTRNGVEVWGVDIDAKRLLWSEH